MNRKEAHIQLQEELEHLQTDMMCNWLDKSLPKDWAGLDFWEPIDKPKTRVTIRLDQDVVRWFRKMGPNYSRRINRVLRVYYCAIVSGHIDAHPGDNTVPRILLAAQAEMENRGG